MSISYIVSFPGWAVKYGFMRLLARLQLFVLHEREINNYIPNLFLLIFFFSV